ncbi:MAG: alanine racemase [Anaerolineales bacterium]|nr:alanine racemase [Anaerolineales bacterium]
MIFRQAPLILHGMHPHEENSNWLEISRGAITNNVQQLEDITHAKVMAVVKANGYGHGIGETAKIAANAGVSYCGVARIDEAIELRRKGVDSPIMVLGYTHSKRFLDAIGSNITLTIFQQEQVDALLSAAANAGKIANVHVKVDTGMSRLGAPPDLAYSLVQRLGQDPGVFVEGIFTHFACADEPEKPVTAHQERQFLDLMAEIEAAGLRPPLVHAANSAAALTRPTSRLDMVRIGIALYGLNPSKQVSLPSGFQTSLTWRARLSAVFNLPPGRGISYGHDYITKGHETIGVVPVGYGDGFRRAVENYVLVHGQRIPVLGRVCMDQIMVRLDGISNPQVGDEVVLIGTQGDSTIRAGDLAENWGTVNYEVTCGLSARVPRIYVD